MNRVAYVSTDPGVPVFGSKGASVHVQAVVRELVRRGAEVHLVAARVGGDRPRGLAGVTVHELPRVTGTPGPEREASAHASATAAASVLDDLHAPGPLDLVLERYSLWSDAAMTWADAHGVPSVLEVNAPLIDEQAEHRVLADRSGAEAIARRAFAAAGSVITVSEPVADWVALRTDERGHVHVVPNGVDTSYVRPGAAPAAGHRTGFTVGFVGTLKPWHGVDVLLEGFARIARVDVGACLRLVGDGPQREALAEQAEQLGVREQVDLVGAVAPQDMPGELAAMDVAVAPYPELPDFYFSPLKLYEYLAAGLPVVASDIGPCADILDGGALGVLVTPGDATELAAVLAGLRSDAVLRHELGRAGRQAAVDRYDWSLVVARILDTIPRSEPSLADDLLGRTA